MVVDEIQGVEVICGYGRGCRVIFGEGWRVANVVVSLACRMFGYQEGNSHFGCYMRPFARRPFGA